MGKIGMDYLRQCIALFAVARRVVVARYRMIIIDLFCSIKQGNQI